MASRINVRQLRLEKKCKKFQNNPLRPSYKPRLHEISAPAPVWTLFYRQSEAIFFSQSLSEKTLVFAVENKKQNNNKRGTRRFGVASTDEFWFYYKSLPKGERHFYEVIQNGSPCHLYFDLEFDKTVNHIKDGNAMVKLWIEYVCCCIEKVFKIKISSENVLKLDSTTSVKFSQHLIFHLPNAVFQNNLECGYFVHKICNDLRQFLSNEEDKSWICDLPNSSKLHQVWVKKSDGSEELFVDEGVYSKNRNFRMFMSSKVGKNVELKLADDCTFPCKRGTACCIFHNSGNELPRKKQCLSAPSQLSENSKAQLVFLASLITNITSDKSINFLTLPNSGVEKVLSIKGPNSSAQKSRNSNTTCFSGTTEDNNNIPFGELAKFVTSLVQSKNPNGYVKKWTHFPSSNVVLYDIDKSRYCFNVGREHKSNRIMYVAELTTLICYQKCYDPVCRNADYKSDAVSFPLNIMQMIKSSSQNSGMDKLNQCDTPSGSELVQNAKCDETPVDFKEYVSDDELIKFAESTEASKKVKQQSEISSDDELCKAAAEIEAFQDETFIEEFFNV